MSYKFEFLFICSPDQDRHGSDNVEEEGDGKDVAVRHSYRETCQGQTQVHTVSHDLHLRLRRRQPQYFLPLHSIILYCRQFDWQNIFFMNMHEASDQSSSNEIACYN